MKVEFLRQSNDGRITLVLDESAKPVGCLWALMALNKLEDAQMALAKREEIFSKDVANDIGTWRCEDSYPVCIVGLERWASSKGIDAVIWTALGPKFQGDKRAPTQNEVITYLSALIGPERDNAERYVRRAPRQIDTEYRKQIEAKLGWSPSD